MTNRRDGDFHAELADRAELIARQATLTATPWAMLNEEHGATVVRVGEHVPAWETPGDALVHHGSSATLAVWVGDCAPVALIGDNGWFGVAHAGWRGLTLRVLDNAVSSLRDRGSRNITAVLGACIHGCCYEFGIDDLCRVADAIGCDPGVLGATSSRGRLSLDMVSAVRANLARCGVEMTDAGECTSCSGRYWSHRRSADLARQAMYTCWRSA